jgi:hypothetical protein
MSRLELWNEIQATWGATSNRETINDGLVPHGQTGLAARGGFNSIVGT